MAMKDTFAKVNEQVDKAGRRAKKAAAQGEAELTAAVGKARASADTAVAKAKTSADSRAASLRAKRKSASDH